MKDKKEIILLDELQEVFKKVGDNPLEEPKLYEMLRSDKVKKSQVIKELFKGTDLKIADFDAIEIAKLFNKVSKKIMLVRNEDGTFKKTKGTENCDLPNFEQVDEIQELWEEAVVGNNSDSEKKLDSLVWKISGLKKKGLTEWEQVLVKEQILASAYDATMTSLGQDLKN